MWNFCFCVSIPDAVFFEVGLVYRFSKAGCSDLRKDDGGRCGILVNES